MLHSTLVKQLIGAAATAELWLPLESTVLRVARCCGAQTNRKTRTACRVGPRQSPGADLTDSTRTLRDFKTET